MLRPSCLVFTLHCLTLLILWSALLKDAADANGWGATHQTFRRIFATLLAWGRGLLTLVHFPAKPEQRGPGRTPGAS
jgi:hypothetical protein